MSIPMIAVPHNEAVALVHNAEHVALQVVHVPVIHTAVPDDGGSAVGAVVEVQVAVAVLHVDKGLAVVDVFGDRGCFADRHGLLRPEAVFVAGSWRFLDDEHCCCLLSDLSPLRFCGLGGGMVVVLLQPQRLG